MYVNVYAYCIYIFNAKRDQQEVYCMCKIYFVQVCTFVYIYICHPVFEHYMENGPFIDDKHDDEALNRMMFQLANRKS